MNRIKSVFCFFLLLSLAACSDDDQKQSKNVTFDSFGLDNRIVHKLKMQNNIIYAATDNGIYKRNISGTTEWELIGLQGEDVSAMDIKNDIIVAAISNYAEEDFKLFRTENGGTNWIQVETNFGGAYPEPVRAIRFHPTQNKIYGVGYNVIAESENLGGEWQIIHGSWGAMATGLSFVEVNQEINEIWAGGQNAIEELILYKISSSNTVQWTTLLPSPSVAKKIAFHPLNNAEVLIGAEGGIIKTTNSGSTWSTIKDNHEDSRFYFGVSYDHSNPDIIYAAGWLKNFTDPQPLILNISEDKGNTWKEYQHQDATLLGGVYDMVLVQDENKIELYMGLYKGGVYKASVE